MSRPAADLRADEMTRAIEEYLERCYQAHSVPRASEFAASLDRSARTVRRHVKNLYGLSLGRLLRQKRLEKTALLLRTTDLTIEEIMSQTAPGDRRSFFRSFRSTFHRSPREYRSSFRTESAPR
jgi:transcriptional regulator GlxA family with amidase domain